MSNFKVAHLPVLGRRTNEILYLINLTAAQSRFSTLWFMRRKASFLKGVADLPGRDAKLFCDILMWKACSGKGFHLIVLILCNEYFWSVFNSPEGIDLASNVYHTDELQVGESVVGPSWKESNRLVL